MNLQQLRYAVEVAKTGSITAAAKNLYMGQPNLSKSIRELEAELGITLFERTARGVAPTKNGEDFLGYARSIIAQMESLETMFGPHTETGTQLSVCAPRASYVAQAFSRYLGAEGRAPLQVQYRETSAAAVISDVASGARQSGRRALAGGGMRPRWTTSCGKTRSPVRCSGSSAWWCCCTNAIPWPRWGISPTTCWAIIPRSSTETLRPSCPPNSPRRRQAAGRAASPYLTAAASLTFCGMCRAAICG